MSPVLIPSPAADEFTPAIPVGAPLGMPVANYSLAHHTAINAEVSMGVWECSQGTFRRQIMQAEYSYFIEGSGVFTPDQGESIAFKAGDSIYFYPNTHGTWLINDRVRKSYVIM